MNKKIINKWRVLEIPGHVKHQQTQYDFYGVAKQHIYTKEAHKVKVEEADSYATLFLLSSVVHRPFKGRVLKL